MKNILITLGLFITISTFAQSFKSELDENEIENYKKHAEFQYEIFYQSVLNILDERLSPRQRLLSRNVLTQVFATSSSLITDYRDLPQPTTLPVHKYANVLYDLERDLPIVDKSYKFSDSIYVRSTTRSFRNKYMSMALDERFKKEFRVYKGEIFFIERLVNSTASEKFDLELREDIRKIDFRIIHNENDQYELMYGWLV